MRQLTDHAINPANERLSITVCDERGSGGANHVYVISGFLSAEGGGQALGGLPLLFQNGPIAEAGVNGITHEALIAVLCDRLRGFQTGRFANADNAEALAHLELAMEALKRRTRARIALGIEGTHIPTPTDTPGSHVLSHVKPI